MSNWTRLLLPVVLLGAGCSEDAVGSLQDFDATAATGDQQSGIDPRRGTLHISPARLAVQVINDKPVLQQYVATLIAPDGSERDVTAETRFELTDPRFGSWEGAALTVSGTGAGPTEVIATVEGVVARGTLAVHVRGIRLEGEVPIAAPELFAQASLADACAAQLAYPADRALLPANLAELDIHWTDTTNDLFAVTVANRYVDLTIYTHGRDPLTPHWTAVGAHDWAHLELANQPMTLQVAALSTSAPAIKCATAPRTLELTREPAQGAVYYWSTDLDARAAGQSGQGIVRFDLRTPEVAPAPLFAEGEQPAACVGCHALSRDGSRIAYTLDSASGAGAVLDLATNLPLMPTGPTAPRWSSAVFNDDGSKLLAVQDGQMRLLEADGGAELQTVVNSPGMRATNPEFSPDGTMLASVETSGDTDWVFGDASVVVRTFDRESNQFGAIRTVLPFSPLKDLQSYYPSWSPDGKWLAVTRSWNGDSYSNPEATVWVINVAGEVAPLEITSVTGTNSWARWLPFENSVAHADGRTEPVYFLSFSSTRPFGTRIVDGGRAQLWMQPFFPQRALAGTDPTGAALRAPYQGINTSNHSAQWATGIVTP